MKDGRFEAGKVFYDSEEVRESVANMEGAGEVEFYGEVEHFFEEADLFIAVIAGIVVVKTDFADGD